jgi:YegS/Rv2252/BmrU family lipid kinase
MTELHVKVIVNPAAGSRSVGRQWPYIKKQLQNAGLLFDHEFTQGSGHTLDIANRAISSGYNYLIAVGGDGTVNEVANEILSSSNPLDIILGIVSTGTANAFSSSLGVTKNNRNIGDHSDLTQQRRVLIDVGIVKYWHHGQPRERFFLNEASTGLAAEIVDAWKSLPKGLGKSANSALRTAAAYKALSNHCSRKVRLQVGNEVESIYICAVMVSNGRYCADGMLIAPHASLNDGLLNAIVISHVSRFEILKIRPALYTGNHIQHPKIREINTTSVSIESDEPLIVEADGEILGECPATFMVMPSALNIVPIF